MSVLPTVDDIAVDPQLAIIALVEFAVAAAARAVIAAHPDLDLAGSERSDPELEAARAVVEECEILRYCLEDYLVRVLDRHLRIRSNDWPF